MKTDLILSTDPSKWTQEVQQAAEQKFDKLNVKMVLLATKMMSIKEEQKKPVLLPKEENCDCSKPSQPLPDSNVPQKKQNDDDIYGPLY